MNIGLELLIDFFVFLASASIGTLVWFRITPRPSKPLTKKTIILRVCLWIPVLIAIAAIAHIIKHSIFISVLVGYGLVVFACLWSFISDHKDAAKDFWEDHVAPLYPLIIVVLIIVVALYARQEKKLFERLEIKETEDYEDGRSYGYDEGYEDGYEDGAEAHYEDYDNGYAYGYECGHEDTYSELTHEYENRVETAYEEGYSLGYDDGWYGLEPNPYGHDYRP